MLAEDQLIAEATVRLPVPDAWTPVLEATPAAPTAPAVVCRVTLVVARAVSTVEAAVESMVRSVGSSSQWPPAVSIWAAPSDRVWPEVSTWPPPPGPPALITAPSAMVVESDRPVWGAVTPTST